MVKKWDFPQRLRAIFRKKTGLKDVFNAVVNKMLTADKLQKAWNALVDEFDLADNSFILHT